jgi:integrase
MICATLLLGKGFNGKFVQELLGHATIAITLDTYSHANISQTMDIYVHLLSNMQDEAAAAMESALT